MARPPAAGSAGLSLRIHGGEARGRILRTPRGIRPTSGQVVEAIFNLLADEIPESRVLDLFSGSGALGLEALSRGASAATFVDAADACVSVVRGNLETLRYTERATVVRADAVRWLGVNADAVAAADVVMLDPPYDDPALVRTLVELDRLTAKGAVVVAEHGRDAKLPELQRLHERTSRRYGDTALTIYEATP